jgi:hypothetical protein
MFGPLREGIRGLLKIESGKIVLARDYMQMLVDGGLQI